ncbi:C-terminal Src kinase isoform X2 [Choristoneura fumiferana]|uniref:C-terminal Src kinase isoform X2 n=1 Tax=Choristoneura fumiferana TaxID=7141 RepID=UPI003D15EF85
MNSDVHRHQAHPPLAQHSVGPCGWYSASAAPAPTAPARIKRAQPPHQLPSGGGVSSNGPHAPVSPTALQSSVPHNNVMPSSARAPAPAGPAPAMHTSQTASGVAKGPSDLLVSSACANPPPAANRLVNMTQFPWHHGAISRERAEALLSSSPDGVFLVRESTNFPGDHTLCVRFRGRVEHYRVKWATAPDSQTQRLTIDDEEFFDTMNDLIKHYLQDADGLCTKLVRYLPKAAPNGANNNGALQPPYPPHPQQPPPYPPTPHVPPLAHAAFQPTYSQQLPPTTAAATDQVDATNFLEARWVINERDLEIRENIGKGEFGDVMLGILNGNLKVAVKILKDREAASKFRAEATVMASLKHENLVRLLGLVFSASGTCLVTEHCAQGSLLDYLRSRGRHYVTQLNQINFAYDACCGMEYMERSRVVHRDLAARNVLISAEGTAKVADFGLARAELAPDDPADALRVQAKLPIKWTAPEALKYNKFSNKSDMWSFGILLWEIYSFGRVPYPRIPLAEVVRHVERGYRMEAPEGCPAGPYDVMRAAWHADPAQRPAFQHTRRTLAAIRDQAHAQPQPQPAPPHP